jgi:hypothetical protein
MSDRKRFCLIAWARAGEGVVRYRRAAGRRVDALEDEVREVKSAYVDMAKMLIRLTGYPVPEALVKGRGVGDVPQRPRLRLVRGSPNPPAR